MSETLRVHRGASWYYQPTNARVARRYRYPIGNRGKSLGIRLARDPIHRLAKEAKDE